MQTHPRGVDRYLLVDRDINHPAVFNIDPSENIAVFILESVEKRENTLADDVFQIRIQFLIAERISTVEPDCPGPSLRILSPMIVDDGVLQYALKPN